ncbi:superinfection immunity protein [Kaistia sp. UC242_56]|uniref:superinfection immunity protein n=1 Tax=Kaistia sp. UC242_56 TaxID=3374625 RepID=UPI00379A6BA5
MSPPKLAILLAATIWLVPTLSWAQTTSSPSDDAVVLFFLAILVVVALVYAIPSIIAFSRGHPNRWAILVVNLCFGATLIGWLICLVWAMNAVHRSKAGSHGGESGLNVFVNDERLVRFAEPAPVQVTAQGGGEGQSASDLVEQLTKLAALRSSGAITEGEFGNLRKRILDGLA